VQLLISTFSSPATHLSNKTLTIIRFETSSISATALPEISVDESDLTRGFLPHPLIWHS
jgi:hypothetical protein